MAQDGPGPNGLVTGPPGPWEQHVTAERALAPAGTGDSGASSETGDTQTSSLPAQTSLLQSQRAPSENPPAGGARAWEPPWE